MPGGAREARWRMTRRLPIARRAGRGKSLLSCPHPNLTKNESTGVCGKMHYNHAEQSPPIEPIEASAAHIKRLNSTRSRPHSRNHGGKYGTVTVTYECVGACKRGGRRDAMTAASSRLEAFERHTMLGALANGGDDPMDSNNVNVKDDRRVEIISVKDLSEDGELSCAFRSRRGKERARAGKLMKSAESVTFNNSGQANWVWANHHAWAEMWAWAGELGMGERVGMGKEFGRGQECWVIGRKLPMGRKAGLDKKVGLGNVKNLRMGKIFRRSREVGCESGQDLDRGQKVERGQELD
ncbi:hypothetical protein E2P81_ATG10383 [Venturia nashicola]|nr:hypothetical protein E2P81_ATG10383 [Venturia nashicola]